MSSDSGGLLIPFGRTVCLYVFKVLRECEEQANCKLIDVIFIVNSSLFGG